MTFSNEAEFEDAMIRALQRKGWEDKVLTGYTEEKLISNWADILFQNNRHKDKLGDAPLTRTEMQQIIEQITALRTPLKLNGFINGKSVRIKRDNPQDPEHLGKEISLKIYDRREIAAGQSRYQIVRQPKFATNSHILGQRRGDLMLLINGMPVIHIELKRSGIPLSKAYNQIAEYNHHGVFSGLFSLIQVFVASTPEESVYFANPGPDGIFNPSYYFHWADYNNEPINQWNDVVSNLLAIPMAHQLIGFYTVADSTDGVLKVMRSYQYWATNKIVDGVAKIDWEHPNQRGGFVWHTTGSGKTMTSFKSAQLIADAKTADKVLFLMDRIELGTQSLGEYRGFAEAHQEVQETENTFSLVAKLLSSNPNDTLIVTSIQKMSRIHDDAQWRQADLEKITAKRIVFVVDEAHRSTFGDMLVRIKQTFPRAVFFGFTGTPIQKENQKKKNTTADIFGDELHRYSIADGIRDENVLGFDPYHISVFPPQELRKAIALEKARAFSEEEALADPAKAAVYYKYLDSKQIPMAGQRDENGKYTAGIEDLLPRGQYEIPEYRKAVVTDINNKWSRLSRNSKFHAIFATSSINEAIDYYRLFKEIAPELKTTALFDPNIDHNESANFKTDALEEILRDYNERYGRDYTQATHSMFKKDVSARLAHKRPHERIADKPEEQLNILIVVDQMLTGFDSKWVNTLYLDKVIEYELLIQAFSRTNRLFGPDKQFGTICYYRKPATMARNIEAAVALYSGDKPLALFVDHLKDNLIKINETSREIISLFTRNGKEDLSELPEEPAVCGKFAKLFAILNDHLEAALIQGFSWKETTYTIDPHTNLALEEKDHSSTIAEGEAEENALINKETGEIVTPIEITIELSEQRYLILAQRYKELTKPSEGSPSPPEDDIYIDIKTHLSEIDTDRIDKDYMESRFQKFLKTFDSADVDEKQKETLLDDLHSSFAALSKEDQDFANLFIHDVLSYDAQIIDGKPFRDYLNDYKKHSKQREIEKLVTTFGIFEQLLVDLLQAHVNEKNLNEYGRFDDLKSTVDQARAKNFFDTTLGAPIPPFKVHMEMDKLLRNYILHGILPKVLKAEERS